MLGQGPKARRSLAVLLGILFAAAPAGAEAATLFAAAGGSGADPCTSRNAPCTLQAAIAAASDEDDGALDTIEVLGPLQESARVVLDDPDDPIRLIGSGRDGTTTLGPAPAGVELVIGPGSLVRELAVVSAGGAEAVAIAGGAPAGGILRNVDVEQQAADRPAVVVATGAEPTLIDNVVISAPSSGAAIPAVAVGGPGAAVIEASSVTSGLVGIVHSAAALELRQARIDVTAPGPGGTGIFAGGGGASTLDASSSLITVAGPGPSGAGIALGAGSGDDIDADLRQLTIDSRAAPAAGSGIRAAEAGSGSADATVLASSVRGFAADIDPVGAASIDAVMSNFVTGAPSGGAGNLALDDPGYADPPGGDFRLLDGSALIDAGGDEALGPRESRLDLDGVPRIQDGDGDRERRRDIGAYEHDLLVRFVLTGPRHVQAGKPLAGVIVCPLERCDVVLRGRIVLEPTRRCGRHSARKRLGRRVVARTGSKVISLKAGNARFARAPFPQATRRRLRRAARCNRARRLASVTLTAIATDLRGNRSPVRKLRPDLARP